MNNQILIPTVATSKDDIRTSWSLARSVKGYEPGLMVVIQGGFRGITGVDAEEQKSNLSGFREEYGERPIVVMLSSMPIREMDFFHNTPFALEHVKKGVEFAKSLPVGKRRILTFHLNALMPPDEFAQVTDTMTLNIFETRIAPALKEAAECARANDVELKIETVPRPEFGDVSVGDKREYLRARLRQLRNPYLISSSDPISNFNRLRGLGLGICMDLCHSRTLPNNLLEEANMLVSSDVVHLNDGSGNYTEEGGVFSEGVVLGEGEIQNLPDIIRVLNEKMIACVLEIRETDFENRPNTKRSIEFLNR